MLWSCRQGRKTISPIRIPHSSPLLFHGDRFPTSAALSQQLSIRSLSWVITRMVLPFRASLFNFLQSGACSIRQVRWQAYQGSVSCGWKKRWRRRWQAAASARRTGRTGAHPCSIAFQRQWHYYPSLLLRVYSHYKKLKMLVFH